MASKPIGVVFPQTEIGADPGGVRAFAQATAELGYDHLLAYDHVLGAEAATHTHLTGPYREQHQFHEILVLFGYLAAVAPGLELVSGVIIAPQRQTALLAKQAAEVDILTGGRFRCGLGIGWNDVEYEALGEDFTNRGKRLEEQIELMRKLWTEPVFTFKGKWHTVTAAGINPLPVQQPIPIWIGASAEPALRRAVKLADGFFPQRPLEGGWEATFERMQEWAREDRRDWGSFGIDARINVGVDTPDDWRRAAEEWLSRGATHLTLATMGGGLAGPDPHIERIREARDALNGI